MLAGVRVQVKPVAGDTELVSVTVPVNPLIGATVIVEVPATPALTVTVVGLALTEKSVPGTVKVTVAECDSVPLVPVTVTVYVPLAEGVHERVDAPEPVTLVGVKVHVRPDDGDTVAARLTTPEKPLTAVIVIVEVPATPTVVVTVVGLAAIVKSWTV